MDPISVLKAGTEAISLVSALTKLIEESKGTDATPGLRELLDRLQIDAVRITRDLESRLRAVLERLNDYGLSPALSLEQQLSDLRWYNVLTRSRLKSLREELLAMYRQLTSFLDDATAMLLCQNQGQRASAAFEESLKTKRLLDGLFLDAHLPLRTILDGLLATTSRLSARIQAA
jgi:hypothetical protein